MVKKNLLVVVALKQKYLCKLQTLIIIIPDNIYQILFNKNGIKSKFVSSILGKIYNNTQTII